MDRFGDAPGGLKAGKLPPDLLARLLDRIECTDPRVLLGPAVGEDAAVIDFGPTSLIAKTDPITFATDLIGWYAVQVNANDVAACGGDPRWFMATVLLPEGASPDTAERIFDQLHDATKALGVALVGGHTEVTIDLSRPIVCGVMLGEVPAGRFIKSGGALPGDAIILTKGIAIEGTAVLAREMSSELAAAGMSREALQRAERYLFEPGISVVGEARLARSVPGIHAMHDLTEGGIATGLAELATASGVGLAIDAAAVKVLPEPAEICHRLGLDPWGLIASGALLISVAPERAEEVVGKLSKDGSDAVVIGRATVAGEGLKLIEDGSEKELPSFERDEAARALEG